MVFAPERIAGRDIGVDYFIQFFQFGVSYLPALVYFAEGDAAADVYADEVRHHLVMHRHRRADGAAFAAVNVGHYRDMRAFGKRRVEHLLYLGYGFVFYDVRIYVGRAVFSCYLHYVIPFACFYLYFIRPLICPLVFRKKPLLVREGACVYI